MGSRLNSRQTRCEPPYNAALFGIAHQGFPKPFHCSGCRLALDPDLAHHLRQLPCPVARLFNASRAQSPWRSAHCSHFSPLIFSTAWTSSLHSARCHIRRCLCLLHAGYNLLTDCATNRAMDAWFGNGPVPNSGSGGDKKSPTTVMHRRLCCF